MSRHRYLSTACLHETEPGREHLHDECSVSACRYDGTHKTGATCKWCPARCVCPRHRRDDILPGEPRVRIGWEPRDLWVGVYRGPDAVYICPLPCVVIRVRRG